ncbi:MAG: hypothetical protein O3A46_04530 [Candidatus Poribacteria bacterium]|nr:hypothetical protein [Candidatus Poribacteria bacterium]
MSTRFLIFSLSLSLAVALSSARAADIAIIDFADQWTTVRGLTEGFEALGIDFDDAVNGKISVKSDHKILFLSAMYTNNATLHQTLDAQAAVIKSFVENGGVVIEPTQADQNEANVDWLPSGLTVVRSDPDHPDFTILEQDHPLFNFPNKLTDENFIGWGHQGWPTVWESIVQIEGFNVLAETAAGKAAVAEAEFGQGKFLMMCVAPDKYATRGNDDNTKKQAMLFLENIATVYLPTAVSPEGLLATTWGELRR